MPYIGNTPALDYISFAVQNFTVTAGTTVYTLDYSVSNENDIALYINSVAQRPGASFAYSATGTTLTLTSATLATDTMYAVFIGRAVQTVTPPANINLQLADGTAAAPSLNFANDTNTGIFRPAADTIAFTEGGTEAMRIDSSGRLLVGIETSRTQGYGDASSLQLEGTSYTKASIGLMLDSNNTDAPSINFGKSRGTVVGSNTVVQNGDRLGVINFGGADGTDSATGSRITCEVDATPGNNDMPGRLIFSTTPDGSAAPTERMRISSGGSVMINTTANDLGKLNVSGSIYLFDLGSGAGSSTLKYDHLSTGRVTYDTSSRLVKENIENSPYGLNEILKLQPRKYFRKDDQRNEIGLIADEVVDILPEFVPIGQKKLITENKEDVELIPVGVNYEKLTAVLIKGIQELSVKNDVLEARLTALENN